MCIPRLIQFMFPSKSFQSFAISKSFGREVARVVGNDGNRVQERQLEEDAEAKLRRNERVEGKEGGES